MKAKVKCGTCGLESQVDFKEACEKGCPTCGAGDIEIGGE